MNRVLNAFVLMVAASAGVTAADPFVGTWKLNVAKSTASVPLPRAHDVTVEERDGMLILSGTIIMPDGTQRQETSSVPVGGGRMTATPAPPTPADVVMTRTNVNTMDSVVTVKGKEVTRIQDVLSADAKTVTRTVKGIDEQGTPLDLVLVFERQ